MNVWDSGNDDIRGEFGARAALSTVVMTTDCGPCASRRGRPPGCLAAVLCTARRRHGLSRPSRCNSAQSWCCSYRSSDHSLVVCPVSSMSGSIDCRVARWGRGALSGCSLGCRAAWVWSLALRWACTVHATPPSRASGLGRPGPSCATASATTWISDKCCNLLG